MSDIWYTAEIAINTPRGVRWEGVCYVAEGRAWRVRRTVDGVGDVLPAHARITYRTRRHTLHNEAYEQARGRTIHHNLYHGIDPAPPRRYHAGSRCEERGSR